MNSKKMKNKSKCIVQNKSIHLIYIVSLGCAKNFVDTEIAAATLLQKGFGLTEYQDEADVVFINTCAFLSQARDEAQEVISDFEKWKSKLPNSRKIIVGGCIVEWNKVDSFVQEHPSVDAWANIDSVEKIGDIALSLISNTEKKQNFMPIKCKKDYIYDENSPRLLLTPTHYAYLKISDGCDNCCTYCMIPSIRGYLRSRTLESVISEAKNLLKCGVKELIIIAQDTSAFGRDKNNGRPQLAELLRRLDKLPGKFLIRLMYLHPASMDDALLQAMNQCKHLIPCIEMPIQHVSNHILQRMHRKISEQNLRELISKLRKEYHFAIRTTFMVGFPGETDEDFENLCEFVRETKFTRLGVFAYSQEQGTPAAEMDMQVPQYTAVKRVEKLMSIQQKISLEFNQSFVGNVVDIIVDEIQDNGKTTGRMLYDAPEIDNVVYLSGAYDVTAGDICKAKVKKVSEYELYADVCKNEKVTE